MTAMDDAAARLQALVQRHWPGLRCRWLASVTSTNTVLADMARSSAFEPQVLVADAQTHGRGRLGRAWKSAPGSSLTFSVALPLAAADWSGLSLAIGVALVESLGIVQVPSAPRLKLKWPNDLWLVDGDGAPGARGRKLGGVLVESVASKNTAGPSTARRVAIIGIGLNLQPRHVVDADGLSNGYSSLSEIWSHDHELKPESVLGRTLPAVLDAVQRFEREGFQAFAGRYAHHDLLAGCRVGLTGGGPHSSLGATAGLTGVARGVDERGALLVVSSGTVHAISSGEVSVRLEDDRTLAAMPAER